MGHIVKCAICGESFDRDKEPCEKVNARRYAHLKCVQDGDQKILKMQSDKDRFYQMVKAIYGPGYNYMMINKQAESYIKDYGFTWSGMTGCLHWFYNINHGSIEEGHGGVGIIPFIYEDVKKYYQDLYRAQQENEMRNARAQVVEFSIQSPRAWHQPPRLMSLEDDDE